MKKNFSPSSTERAQQTLADSRWKQVVARDKTADGQFFYSVASTGVYCRPSCASRLARPEHVAFHVDAHAAERAGFRPCKRCKPDQLPLDELHQKTIITACRQIEATDHMPRLDALAAQAGMSKFHFHRLFKQTMGLTPQGYAKACRSNRVRENLTQGRAVMATAFDAGYGAGSRFYAEADKNLGMKPSAYRNGGARTIIHFAVGECKLGSILVAQSERGLCAILLGEDAEALLRDLQDRFPKATLVGGDASFESLVSQVVGFVEQPALGLQLPLDVRGTVFQQRVWQALNTIPPGTTLTYTELAERIGAPKAIRAVASACAANPLAVAIPCHRVVRTDGGLGGYRWGLARKQILLDQEAARAGQHKERKT
ncbi:bifunctional DNA-binding transcriptional regulator/O6-methylguanine-DNA methyltransferase Ada [uncultured Oxalicibacterium sp.]|uniref:bifunctional DNA-binding transcriptional regulator/O6-methylguanine-DNA methyltransferase Ada n=1 Tax=uncultured Oxalicibacterium sp. TaxID=1168540 RepID=UPI0025EDC853|nr:bifunctional DNA-binding transcriptional regulator/O6-methylguanine-DNA methyltransferase Ada [uncultured Oxalicibacterium sp.]